MYYVYRVQDIVRIPPEMFHLPLEEAALKSLREKYEGTIDKDLGLILAVFDVNVSEEGVIIHGDGATYHETEFSILAFKPLIKEVVEGEVVEITDFGAFISLGPLDALAHKSQILDDVLMYDGRRGALIGKETKRILERGDHVRARIITISTSMSNKIMRIGVTMRQPFLGKLEWIKEDLERIYGKPKKPKKKK
mgnify:FL=1